MSSKKPNTSRWTVSKYANEIYIPSRLQHPTRPITEKSGKWYAHVVKKLEECHGPIKLREVTTERLDEFYRWSLDQGCKDQTCRHRCEIVRAIVRDWRPGSFDEGLLHGSPSLQFLYADKPGTLEHLFHARYLPANTKIGSTRTVEQYGKGLSRFSEYLGHTATTDDLTDEKVGGFQRWLVEVKGNRPVSANGVAKQVKALWNWAAKKRLVAEFPTVGKLPEAERVPKSWTEKELAALHRACLGACGCVGKLPACDFWTAFHLLLWDSGERTGAMLAMRWEWLDLESGTLAVPGEFRKGRVKAMVYHLKPATVEAIKRLHQPGEPLIFPLPWTPGTFYYHYRQLVESAGLNYEPHECGPQRMRRTFASFLERLGGNATKALGHSSRRVTTDSYLDPRVAELESENVRLPALGDPIDEPTSVGDSAELLFDLAGNGGEA